MTYRAWNLKTLDRAAVRELTHAIAEQNTEELEYHSQSEEPWTEAQYNATRPPSRKKPPCWRAFWRPVASPIRRRR